MEIIDQHKKNLQKLFDLIHSFNQIKIVLSYHSFSIIQEIENFITLDINNDIDFDDNGRMLPHEVGSYENMIFYVDPFMHYNNLNIYDYDKNLLFDINDYFKLNSILELEDLGLLENLVPSQSRLKFLLFEAVLIEDFETASKIRDQIK